MLGLTSVILALGISLFIATILHLILPGFENQRRHANRANDIVKTDHEIKKMKEGAIVNLISDQMIPKVEKKLPLDRIFGEALRKKYELLGLDETFEQKIAKITLGAIIGSLATLVFPIVTQKPIFIIVTPIMGITMFLNQIRAIDKKYKERQTKIIKDLPTLIDKMMIALEAGKPFSTTFKHVEKTSSPVMSQLLKGLIANMRIMKETEAIELFAKQTGIPVMQQFSAAVKIGIEVGYEEAYDYFEMIKGDLKTIRKTSLEELTRSKPEKMKQLYILLAIHGFVAIIIAFALVLMKVNEI